MRKRTIQQYVKWSQGTVRAVTFDRFSNHQDDASNYIATRCRGLTSLEFRKGLVGESLLKSIRSGIKLRTLKLPEACQITYDTLVEVLERCGDLEVAEFFYVQSKQGVVEWKCDLPRLQRLTLGRERSWLTSGLNLVSVLTPSFSLS